MQRGMESQHQTLRRAAGLEKLVERNLDHMESARFKLPPKRRAHGVQQDRVADMDRVAGKARRIRLRDRDALLRRVARLDARERRGIEGRGIEQHKAARERGKAGVQVIEARIDQMEPGHRDAG